MSDEPKSLHSPRSRAPIDEIGVKWWDQFGGEQTEELTQMSCEPKFKNKSTNTTTLTRQKEVTFKLNQSKLPKDIVLKKWREDQARMNYEKARKALINSLKEKFRNTSQMNSDRTKDGRRVVFGEVDKSIEMIEDNVEDSSNANVNHKAGEQGKGDSFVGNDRVDIEAGVVEDVSHARKARMESGGELAQWKLAPRGSSVAGAEGGLRGFTEDMPVSLALNF